MEVEQIIDYSLSLTASELKFAFKNDITNGKANCVGYAQLCAAICNQAMAANGIEGKARPVVGYIESNGINWCKVLKAIAPKASYKNFVKDHDFVELTIGSRRYYFDPSIYDVFGFLCVNKPKVVFLDRFGLFTHIFDLKTQRNSTKKSSFSLIF